MPASQEHFRHPKEQGGGGECDRCLPFLVPPCEKGSIFRVKVTGLLLWGVAEPLSAIGRRVRVFQPKHPLPPAAGPHSPWPKPSRGCKSSSRASNSPDPALAERASRFIRGEMHSKNASVVSKEWKNQG